MAGVAVAEGVLFAAEVGGDPAAFPGQPLRWLVIGELRRVELAVDPAGYGGSPRELYLELARKAR